MHDDRSVLADAQVSSISRNRVPIFFDGQSHSQPRDLRGQGETTRAGKKIDAIQDVALIERAWSSTAKRRNTCILAFNVNKFNRLRKVQNKGDPIAIYTASAWQGAFSAGRAEVKCFALP